MLFKAEFVTKSGETLSIETEKLNVLASDGRRTILSNHMAIMLPLELGVIETQNNGLHHYVVDSGILYFEDNSAKILTDDFMDVDKIEIEMVNSELKEAEEILNNTTDNLVRLSAGRKYKWYKTVQEAYNKYKRN